MPYSHLAAVGPSTRSSTGEVVVEVADSVVAVVDGVAEVEIDVEVVVLDVVVEVEVVDDVLEIRKSRKHMLKILPYSHLPSCRPNTFEGADIVVVVATNSIIT